MNQSVAFPRRASLCLAAALLAVSALAPHAFAQTQTAPGDSATVNAAAPATPAETVKGKKAKTPKAAKAPKAEKAPKVKAAKTPKVKAEKPAKAVTAAAEKPAKAPKAAKTPKAKTPEKPLEEQKKEDGIYAKGSNWIGFRFGYAKRSGDFNGDGLVGYGMGYQHMISRRHAFAASVNHDIVGHFGSQTDVAVPFTAEFQRHFAWKGGVRPFVGLGGGYYYRKYYRTGSEYNTTVMGGPHVSFGFTTALDDKHVLGLETRWAKVASREGITNPTFGTSKDSETLWTVKATWGWVY